MRKLLYVLALTIILIATSIQVHAYEGGEVIVVKVQDVIAYSTYEEVEGALSLAIERNSPLLILMNTPGGSLDATLKIVESLLNSPIPIIVYVHPKGATAWSAGSLILLASHVASMSPGTVVGSAQPVSYNPATGSEPVTDPKILNAVTSYMREVAKYRGRNETAAELFVTKNLNLGPEEALRMKVIDLVASDLEILLTKLDGVVVKIDGRNYTLKTYGASLTFYEGGLRVKVLSILSNPTIASILFLVGLWGLIFGLAYGEPASATVGGLLLLLGLIGLGFDVNLVSILLISMGIILMLVELFVTPGFGVLGVGGIIMLLLGALLSPLNIDPSRWAIHPEWYTKFNTIILTVSLPLIGSVGFIFYKALRARRLKHKLYISDMVGQEAEALDKLGPSMEGFVRCAGEYWRASSNEVIEPGEKVVVIAKEGPKLIVRKVRPEGRKMAS